MHHCLRYRVPQAVTAQEQERVRREAACDRVDFKVVALADRAVEHVLLRMLRCFFRGKLVQLDQALDKGVIAGDLLDAVLAGDQVGPAITDMDDINQIPDNYRGGNRSPAFGHMLCHHIVGHPDRLGQRLRQERRAGIHFIRMQHKQRQKNPAHDLLGHYLSGNRGRLLPMVMPAHAISDDEQAKIWHVVGVSLRGEKGEDGILIVGTDLTDICAVAECDMMIGAGKRGFQGW